MCRRILCASLLLATAAHAAPNDKVAPEPPNDASVSAATAHSEPTPVVPWQRYPVYAVDPTTGTLVPTGNYVVFSPVGGPPPAAQGLSSASPGATSDSEAPSAGPAPAVAPIPASGLAAMQATPSDPKALLDVAGTEPGEGEEAEPTSDEAEPDASTDPEAEAEETEETGATPAGQGDATRADDATDATPAAETTPEPDDAGSASPAAAPTDKAAAPGPASPPSPPSATSATSAPLTKPSSSAGGATAPTPTTMPSPAAASAPVPIAAAVGAGLAAGAVTGAVVASQRGGGGTRIAAAATLGTACNTDADCDDGRFCNGEEVCRDGACAPGTPPALSDEIACTLDVCDEASRTVQHLPMHSLCSDDTFCNGTELCSPSDGCIAGAPLPEGPDGLGCFDYACVEDEQTLYRSALPDADPLVCPLPAMSAPPAGLTKPAATTPETKDAP